MRATAARDPRVDKTVFLHVGAPKTGTTYVQNVLWNNREALAADGILYPLRKPKEHRIASLDLQRRGWGGRRDPAWEGTWDRMAARVREWSGDRAVISNELLGGATPEQARRAVATLQPAEVHVVFTARDLARQLVSDWQEQVKHTHTVSSERFIDDLVQYELDAPEPFGRMFWGLHDAVRVLGNWGAAVPPERIHLVTVPQPDAPSGLLWERFTSVTGIDPQRYDTRVQRTNTSMGIVETELLRRVNMALGKSLGRRYDALARRLLAETVLAGRRDSTRIRLPQEYYSWAVDRTKEIITGVEAAGYEVVGDLDELIPLPQHGETPRSDDVQSPELLDAAVDAVVGLLQHSAPPRRGLQASGERVRLLEAELQQRRAQPLRTLIRDTSEKHPALMRVRELWWRAVESARARR